MGKNNGGAGWRLEEEGWVNAMTTRYPYLRESQQPLYAAYEVHAIHTFHSVYYATKVGLGSIIHLPTRTAAYFVPTLATCAVREPSSGGYWDMGTDRRPVYTYIYLAAHETISPKSSEPSDLCDYVLHSDRLRFSIKLLCSSAREPVDKMRRNIHVCVSHSSLQPHPDQRSSLRMSSFYYMDLASLNRQARVDHAGSGCLASIFGAIRTDLAVQSMGIRPLDRAWTNAAFVPSTYLGSVGMYTTKNMDGRVPRHERILRRLKAYAVMPAALRSSLRLTVVCCLYIVILDRRASYHSLPYLPSSQPGVQSLISLPVGNGVATDFFDGLAKLQCLSKIFDGFLTSMCKWWQALSHPVTEWIEWTEWITYARRTSPQDALHTNIATPCSASHRNIKCTYNSTPIGTRRCQIQLFSQLKRYQSTIAPLPTGGNSMRTYIGAYEGLLAQSL
ncbi:hypothetical protein ACRALDRAFT_210040 [Sodiomyces alcalophilus JCM 7366]|uniref:uncharacterized protein n=1 Tax=Sodiomyces alcalophilus JCM 7366 TaxID=591952 RepID=UPI0039B67AB7